MLEPDTDLVLALRPDRKRNVIGKRTRLTDIGLRYEYYRTHIAAGIDRNTIALRPETLVGVHGTHCSAGPLAVHIHAVYENRAGNVVAVLVLDR